jgi:hypothetical protein
MASVFRTTAVWQGFIGAPGYTKLSFLAVVGTAGADAATAATRTFLNAFATAMPSGTTIQVQREVGEYDEASGLLLGELTAAATPAPISGTSVNKYIGGSGLFIGWRTNTIWQGRRVIGRTFIVPQESTAFDTDGTLTSSTLAGAQSAGNALIADANTTFAVWARLMTTGADGKPHQTNGAAFQVITSYVKDQASGLRSRRA